MKYYTACIFDLDGTLTDSKEGIVHSIEYALTRLGIVETDRNRLTKFIGPPLLESFRRVYGLDDAEAKHAVEFYREYFANKGIFENRVYNGIPVLLDELDVRGCTLAVATSKPTTYTEKILKHFRIREHFDHVVGSNMDLTRTSKKEIIAELLNFAPISGETAVMIGDRADDIKAADYFNMDSIAVNYGYGSRAELSKAQPTYFVDTVAQLESLVLGFVRT